MAVTEVATPTSEAQLALCMLARLETEVGLLRKHLTRLAYATTDELAIAHQATRQAKTVAAMAEYVHRNTKRAVQIAEAERFD